MVTSIRNFISLFAVAALSACSSHNANLDDGFFDPTFEYHSMRGSIRYLGGEYETKAAPNRPTQISFDMPVRKIEVASDASSKVSIRRGAIRIKANPNLPSEGELINVTLFDGRTFPVRVVPGGDQFLPLDGSDGVFNRELHAWNNERGEVNKLLIEVKKADLANSELDGFFRTNILFDKVAIDTPALRAKFVYSYVGKKYAAHILEVSNRTDQAQDLNLGLFHFRNMRAIEAENPKLPARPWPSELGVAAEKPKTSRVYVIVEANAAV